MLKKGKLTSIKNHANTLVIKEEFLIPSWPLPRNLGEPIGEQITEQEGIRCMSNQESVSS